MTRRSEPSHTASPASQRGLESGVVRVDAATHVWGDGSAPFPWSPWDGVPLPDTPAPPSALLNSLSEHSFDAAVCVQPRVYGYDHGYLRAVLQAHPGRITGVGLVDPGSEGAVSALERHVREGFSGVRFITADRPVPSWLARREGDPVWDAAVACGIPVSVLVAPSHLQDLALRARRSPDTVIVIDHLGLVSAGAAPEFGRELLRCAIADNVHVKISALGALSSAPWPYLDLEEFVREIMSAFGPHRVVFGTDWPHNLDHGPWDADVRAIEAWSLDTQVDALLGGNAARLWRLRSPACRAATGEGGDRG